MPSAKDIREFRGFLRQATDRQVQGIYDKEKSAGRDDYTELAVAEAEIRGIELDDIGHSTKKSKARTKSPAQLDREIAATLAGSPQSGETLPYQGRRVPIDASPRTIKAFERSRPYVVQHRGQLYTVVDNVHRGVVAHPAQVLPKGGSRSHATKRVAGYSNPGGGGAFAPMGSPSPVGGSRSLVDTISAGSRVTIVDRFGKERTGRAVMRGPYGWVLNMGGRHGTPAVATADNVVSVRYGK